jgi:hypothetical protein
VRKKPTKSEGTAVGGKWISVVKQGSETTENGRRHIAIKQTKETGTKNCKNVQRNRGTGRLRTPDPSEGWRTPDPSWLEMEAAEEGEIFFINLVLACEEEQPELELFQRALREQLRAELFQEKQHKRVLLQGELVELLAVQPTVPLKEVPLDEVPLGGSGAPEREGAPVGDGAPGGGGAPGGREG